MAVVGIDLGGDNSYVAAYKPRYEAAYGPETIADDQGSRAIPSCVAFRRRNRIFGVDAIDQMVANTKNTIHGFKRLIGRKYNDLFVQQELQHLSYNVIAKQDGSPGIEVHQYLDDDHVFCPEQITAMLLSKIKDTAEIALKTKVKDCVLSVPNYFEHEERKALVDAAAIAGLNVLCLLTDTTAAALAYGIDNQDLLALEKEPRKVVFIDCGHTSFQVSACTFKQGKLKMHAYISDTHLGGRDFDMVLCEHFIKEFKSKYNLNTEVNPRAFLRLAREVKKLKTQMSASSAQLPLNVECFMNNKDLNGVMDRQQMERLCAHLLQRVERTLQTFLQESSLQLDEIHGVEIVGGSSRIPAIKNLIERIFSKQPSTTLNQDEAVARGCALQCVLLSPAMPTRKFKVKDFHHMDLDDSTDETGFSQLDISNYIEQEVKMIAEDRREKERMDARNELEEYVYEMRDKLSSDEIEWLNGEGADCNREVYVEKLQQLKIAEDRREKERMDARNELEKYVYEMRDKLSSDEIEWLNGEGADCNREVYVEKLQQLKIAEDRREKERMDARNELEKYVYEMRDKLSSDEIEWLNGEGADCNREVYVEKLQQLKIAEDRREKERMDARNELEKYVYEMRDKLSSDEIEWLNGEGADCNREVYVEKLQQLKIAEDRREKERMDARNELEKYVYEMRDKLSSDEIEWLNGEGADCNREVYVEKLQQLKIAEDRREKERMDARNELEKYVYEMRDKLSSDEIEWLNGEGADCNREVYVEKLQQLKIAEDRREKERMDARNELEKYVYEMRDKLSSDEIEWLNGEGADCNREVYVEKLQQLKIAEDRREKERMDARNELEKYVYEMRDKLSSDEIEWLNGEGADCNREVYVEKLQQLKIAEDRREKERMDARNELEKYVYEMRDKLSSDEIEWLNGEGADCNREVYVEKLQQLKIAEDRREKERMDARNELEKYVYEMRDKLSSDEIEWLNGEGADCNREVYVEKLQQLKIAEDRREKERMDARNELEKYVYEMRDKLSSDEIEWLNGEGADCNREVYVEKLQQLKIAEDRREKERMDARNELEKYVYEMRDKLSSDEIEWLNGEGADCNREVYVEKLQQLKIAEDRREKERMDARNELEKYVYEMRDKLSSDEIEWLNGEGADCNREVYVEKLQQLKIAEDRREKERMDARNELEKYVYEMRDKLSSDEIEWLNGEGADCNREVYVEKLQQLKIAEDRREKERMDARNELEKYVYEMRDKLSSDEIEWLNGEGADCNREVYVEKLQQLKIAEDRREKERMDARNELEKYVYEMRDKLSSDEIEWLNGEGADCNREVYVEKLQQLKIAEDRREKERMDARNELEKYVYEMRDKLSSDEIEWLNGEGADCNREVYVEKLQQLKIAEDRREKERMDARNELEKYVYEMRDKLSSDEIEWLNGEGADCNREVYVEKLQQLKIAEDRREKERMDARNELEKYVYEMRDKLSSDEIEWLNGEGADCNREVYVEKLQQLKIAEDRREKERMDARNELEKYVYEMRDKLSSDEIEWLNGEGADCNREVYVEKLQQLKIAEDRREKERMDARNELEKYVYEMRDKLSSDEIEWLNGEGADCNREVYVEKLQQLKIAEDRREKERMDARNELEKYVYEMRDKLSSDEIEWLNGEGADCNREVYVEKLQQLKIAEDRREKERMDARNELEKYVYEMRDKLSSDEIEWLNGEGADCNREVYVEKLQQLKIAEDRREKERMDARNELEKYVYEMRDKLSSDEIEWLNGEGTDCNREVYVEKLQQLKKNENSTETDDNGEEKADKKKSSTKTPKLKAAKKEKNENSTETDDNGEEKADKKKSSTKTPKLKAAKKEKNENSTETDDNGEEKADKKKSSTKTPKLKAAKKEKNENSTETDDNGEEKADKKKSSTKTPKLKAAKKEEPPRRSMRNQNRRIPETDFEVEEIVGKRMVRGRPEYLVRWKGYSSDQDSWRDISDLNCPELIKKFYSKNPGFGEKAKKRPSTTPTTTRKPKKLKKYLEVEEIVGKRMVRGRPEYLVRWKGYSSDQDSWRDKSDLNCPELIKKFYSKNPGFGEKAKKRPSTTPTTRKPKKIKKDLEDLVAKDYHPYFCYVANSESQPD